MSHRNVVAASLISLTLLVPSISMAKCDGFWDCSLTIAGKGVKFAGKTVIRTASVVGAAGVGALKAYADEKDAKDIVLEAAKGAGNKIIESAKDTVNDVIEVGEAGYDAYKASKD